jgi:hypothetical protein
LLLLAVDPAMQFSTNLEEWKIFSLHCHGSPSARVSPLPRCPTPYREYAEATQLDPVRTFKRRCYFAKHHADRLLNISEIEVGILRMDALDQLGFDHGPAPGIGASLIYDGFNLKTILAWQNPRIPRTPRLGMVG